MKLIAQSALSSLINLSSKVELAAQMTDERFLADIIKIILVCLFYIINYIIVLKFIYKYIYLRILN